MKSLKNRPIGIFDSGVGGLTVAKSVHKCLPREDIIYFGDTARVPYGNKSRNTIIRFAREIMEFMIKHRVKIVVIACNTASSLSQPFLKKISPVPVVGVITPGVKEAMHVSKNRRIGVIGTNSTISSRAYDREMARTGGSYRLFSKPCPLFVPLVENSVINNKVVYQVAQSYLKGLKSKKIDTLILGCTHYPILKKVIGKVMGEARLVDSSHAVAKEVKEMLAEKRLEAARNRRGGRIKCYISDDVKEFRKMASIFFKDNITVKKAVL